MEWQVNLCVGFKHKVANNLYSYVLFYFKSRFFCVVHYIYWGHMNPIGVSSCYDEGKRTVEALTMNYHQGAGVEVRIAHMFNTYGPWMCLDDGRVGGNFVSLCVIKLTHKQPMTIYGDV